MIQVTKDIIGLWDRASLPTRAYCLPSGAGRSEEAVGENDKIKKESQKQAPVYRASYAAAALSDIDQLFYISSRTYKPELQQDREFLAGQRQARRRHIGGLDAETSARWERREKRQSRKAEGQTATAAAAASTASTATRSLAPLCAGRKCYGWQRVAVQAVSAAATAVRLSAPRACGFSLLSRRAEVAASKPSMWRRLAWRGSARNSQSC